MRSRSRQDHFSSSCFCAVLAGTSLDLAVRRLLPLQWPLRQDTCRLITSPKRLGPTVHPRVGRLPRGPLEKRERDPLIGHAWFEVDKYRQSVSLRPSPRSARTRGRAHCARTIFQVSCSAAARWAVCCALGIWNTWLAAPNKSATSAKHLVTGRGSSGPAMCREGLSPSPLATRGGGAAPTLARSEERGQEAPPLPVVRAEMEPVAARPPPGKGRNLPW